ncbi:hypothetical protein NLJ89_g5342 [Agrocybe chaxingu]|uniref:Uncharacterized protein n=1 Tax=Agrocybe chaxingu TaxID=84603 RepID=A0A9W8K0D8_9AGAR|nr:hypothetical protein NLJ89_g5342 [Agrocybe chaxingu]
MRKNGLLSSLVLVTKDFSLKRNHILPLYFLYILKIVKLNFYLLLAAFVGATSVSAATDSSIGVGAANATVSQLIKSRDMAYAEYKARDLAVKIPRARQLAARAYADYDLIFVRGKTTKEEILEWLAQGEKQGAAAFGSAMIKFHSGGISCAPHCRPFGMEKTVTKTEGSGKAKMEVKTNQYFVMLKCASNSSRPDSKVVIVDGFMVAESLKPPSSQEVYQALIRKVTEMKQMPF